MNKSEGLKKRKKDKDEIFLLLLECHKKSRAEGGKSRHRSFKMSTLCQRY